MESNGQARKMSQLQFLTAEALVAAVIAIVAIIVGIGQFRQHAVDFEARANEKFEIVEQRVERLEQHERTTLTALTQLSTQMERVHTDLTEMKAYMHQIILRLNQSAEPNLYVP